MASFCFIDFHFSFHFIGFFSASYYKRAVLKPRNNPFLVPGAPAPPQLSCHAVMWVEGLLLSLSIMPPQEGPPLGSPCPCKPIVGSRGCGRKYWDPWCSGPRRLAGTVSAKLVDLQGGAPWHIAARGQLYSLGSGRNLGGGLHWELAQVVKPDVVGEAAIPRTKNWHRV